MSIKRLLICFGLVLPLTVPLSADAQWRRRATVDRTVRESMEQGGLKRQRVIVRYRKAVESAVEGTLNARGNKVRRRHRGASALTAEVHSKDLALLADDPNVDGISTDAVVVSQGLVTNVLSGLNLNVVRNTLGLPASMNNLGSGVGVAVIDSGIAAAKDLDGRIVAAYDFTGDTVVAVNTRDGYGHGTHIAGLIASSGLSSNGQYTGVAPAVRLISMRVLDNEGRGYTSDVLEAIDYAVENRARLGIDVINLSLGHPVLEPAANDPLVQAVERATRAGIVVVAAAGNLGRDRATDKVAYAGITSPGNAPSAITVGGIDDMDTTSRYDDVIGRYSSRGPTVFDNFVKPDIVAPGDRLVSLADPMSKLYRTLTGNRKGANLSLSGTSMATGVVSGVVALVLEANRTARRYDDTFVPLTPNAVKAILQYSSIPMKNGNGVLLDTLTQGAGSLNAAGAIALAKVIDGSVPKGSPWLTGAVIPSTRLSGVTYPWAQRVLWGRGILSGGVMLYNEPAWGVAAADEHIVWSSDDHIVWGSDDHIVWGSDDHIVWGSDDHIVWGSDDHIVWGSDDHIVWGSDDHIVWGSDDHVVWGSSVQEKLK